MNDRIRCLVAFLTLNGCLESYIFHANKYMLSCGYEFTTRNDMIAHADQVMIGRAFPWDSTPHGREFWLGLDNRFSDFWKEYKQTMVKPRDIPI
mgnify:CR=1 FL=1